MNLKCRAETADKDADTSAALVVIMFKQRIGVMIFWASRAGRAIVEHD
jgi:hypothetical protein